MVYIAIQCRCYSAVGADSTAGHSYGVAGLQMCDKLLGPKLNVDGYHPRAYCAV